jgi:uncharacterized SAM-binding protein YcdF (DUF218 family)
MVELTKFLWPLLRPDNLLGLGLILAAILLWTRWAKVGRWMATLAALFLATIMLLPAASWLGQPLKSRFPPPEMLPEVIDGIIVLGGSIRSGPTPERPDSLAGISQRLVAFVELARRFPAARLVFTGGTPPHIPGAATEADQARPILAALGLDLARVRFEASARNTLENARRSKLVTAPKPGERWLLVTSALHMPRAVAVFRAAGWPVIPYPVDYPRPQPAPALALNLVGSLNGLIDAGYEWLALLAYRGLGYTRELLPE